MASDDSGFEEEADEFDRHAAYYHRQLLRRHELSDWWSGLRGVLTLEGAGVATAMIAPLAIAALLLAPTQPTEIGLPDLAPTSATVPDAAPLVATASGPPMLDWSPTDASPATTSTAIALATTAAATASATHPAEAARRGEVSSLARPDGSE